MESQHATAPLFPLLCLQSELATVMLSWRFFWVMPTHPALLLTFCNTTGHAFEVCAFWWRILEMLLSFLKIQGFYDKRSFLFFFLHAFFSSKDLHKPIHFKYTLNLSGLCLSSLGRSSSDMSLLSWFILIVFVATIVRKSPGARSWANAF